MENLEKFKSNTKQEKQLDSSKASLDNKNQMWDYYQGAEHPKLKNIESGNLIAKFEPLLSKLAPAIKNHEYDLIVGDDASGRLPTLVLSSIFKKVYEQDKCELPKTIFLATGRISIDEDEEEKKNKVIEHLKNLIQQKQINAPDPDSRTLLVTEQIHSGGTISRLIEMFQEVGFLNIDVAALATLHKEFYEKQEFRKKFPQTRLYVGFDQQYGSEVFHKKPSISGVFRTKHDIIAKKYNKKSRVVSIRKDIKKIVDFYTPYFDKKTKKRAQK
jgi:adenine/guanine phosphoribosyltransferase-like PRPP-binding protein